MVTCPACGQANPDGFRFCGACATPLDGDGEGPVREVRKTVTVVFCDMVGSTALGDRSDPERVRSHMARYHDLARRVLERHGGTIEKFIGDAVMAVFGVPTLHEDDALRAVRAGVELRDELAAAGIPARIGVNTGEVVAGGGEALVTGDAVNVAARLEQAAGAGEVLIGDTTFRLTRDAVRAEAVDGLVVKGKPGPLAAHRLLSVDDRAQAIPRRIDAPLVGRTRELAMLSEAYERAVSDERCHLFTVLGTPGVGKSRLVAELAAGSAAGANVLVGQCLPYGDGITFWPVAEMLRAVAGIGERDDRTTARAALERLVADDEDGLLLADRVSSAIGLGGTSAPVEEVFWAIRRTFERVARDRPAVLVFEDVHWAEPTLLDLIEHIADWSRGGALLVVCTARPDLLELRPAWAGGKTNAATIMLEPLAQDDCGRLVDELLRALAIPADHRAQVVTASEGNPLFVEQMLAMLSDGEAYGSVPPTIQALLAARLDRLEGEERRVVESASIEGRVFHRSALAALAPDSARPALSAHLQRLMRRELIDPDRSLFEGDSAYRFQHVLIRDAAYSSLPKRARAELHERFADWLEQRVSHRIDEYREILAHHFEQAHRLLADVSPDDPHLPELADRARAYLVAAARHAADLGNTVTAFAIARRAIDLPLAPSADAVDLLIETCRIGWRAGANERLLDISGRAQALARSLGDDDRELVAQVHALDARLMADTTFSTADARAVAESAVARCEATGEARGLYDALVAVSSTYHHEGRWSRMLGVLSRAQDVAAELGDERLERDAATQRLGCLYWGDAPVTDGLAFCDEIDRRWPSAPLVQMRVGAARARFLGLLGRLDEAERAATRWYAHAERIGNTIELESRAFTTAFLAELAGDLERAGSELAWSIERLDRRGMRGLVATLAGFRSIVLGRLGRWDEAAAAVGLARQRSHPDDLDSESFWRLAEAALLAHRGDLDAAISMAGDAVRVIDRSDEIVFQAHARMHMAALLEQRGDVAGARLAVEAALDRYRRKGFVPATARAEARLGALAPA